MIIQLFYLHSDGFILGQKREKERRREGGYLLKKNRICWQLRVDKQKHFR
jgi:hypothetical protein